MYEQRYAKPPITEAVIELRFPDAIEARVLEDLSRAFKSEYPREERLTNVGFQVNMLPDAKGSPRPKVLASASEPSFKRSSDDAAQIVVLAPQSVLVSQLAPYPGWEVFLDRFRRDWQRWKGKVGFRALNRIGVRYINRLDIPIKNGLIYDDEYLNFRLLVPDLLGAFLGAATQAQFKLPDSDLSVTINTASVPSPVPNHGSFMLDIDVAKDGNVPQRDEQILELIEVIRKKKNEIFEACVTDAARELFK